MDGIQTYAGPTHQPPADRPIVAAVHAPGGHPGHAAPGPAAKQPSDYLRALRRRAWLALLVAIPLASAGTLLVLRMPAIYAVKATLTIEPPKTDPAIRSLVGSSEMVVNDTAASATYVPTLLGLFKTRSFLDSVLSDPALGLPPAMLDGDPAAEMLDKIVARQVPQSTNVLVTFEGRDPALISRILDHALKKFADRADVESRRSNFDAAEKAAITLKKYAEELKALDTDLAALIQQSRELGPNGDIIKKAEYELLRQQVNYKQGQLAQTQQQLKIAALAPHANPAAQARQQQIAALQEQREMPARRLARYLQTTREPSGDAAVQQASAEVRRIDEKIARLERQGDANDGSTEEAQEQILAAAEEDLRATEARLNGVMEGMRESMPHYQQYMTMTADREIKAKQVAGLREKLTAFQIVTNAQKSPVQVIDDPVTPTVPIRPNRGIYIGLALVMSLGAGLGLVCLLEHIDHSVKVPEHLTAGLALPLFGVVPRMIRSSANHRGGHLWASGTPDSIEADAYRNLRASLLGATAGRGPIATLLITSAKAGEGKSTTALNLAATCARAGERTLLMDVDLRRPSLNGVFPNQDHGHGLVDVLRGDLPWQRVVVQTDLPNLDFLPTGDTRDVPIEVLGSLELRQLLISLSQTHYDRVILDGPAVLGLADCRMLGRIVDAAVLVVRSGSQEIRSLQRAKAMLQQSQVQIAGLIFNGLADDLENWSSYGPTPALGPAPSLPPAGSRGGRALMGAAN